MSKRDVTQIEKRKIRELARRYAAEGYEVLVKLPNYRAPAPICGIRPDLVVKRGDEMIVIEVKSSDSIRAARDTVTQLAEYVRNMPGVRFDLVMTNPKPASSATLKAETMEAELYELRRSILGSIREASKQGRGDLVIILSVVLLEGLLARLAVSRSVYVPVDEWNLGTLARRLADEHVISQSVLDFALDAHRRRNALVHGRAAAPPLSKQEAQDVVNKVSRLVSEWGGKIKMADVVCPVCGEDFNSYLNLARHMVLKDRPSGEHIQYLEDVLGKPFAEFGWKSDRKIAAALSRHLSQRT